MDLSYYPALPPLLLEEEHLRVLPEDRCPYLPGRQARVRGFASEGVHPLNYHLLMDRGFRRSGLLFYQPVCRGCRECVPLRVPVRSFTPGKSQRRIARRNASLAVTVCRLPDLDDPGEVLALFGLHQQDWHERDPADVVSEMDALLEPSPVETLVFRYRDAAGRLIAAGLCDVSELSLSSVYFFFDPAESARSLGTFGALWEIEYARRHHIPYYYLGYWVEQCPAMAYKSRFRPHELLGTCGNWRPAHGPGARR